MPDVVDLIISDHRELQDKFARMRSTPDERPMLVPVVAALLVAHSRAEEEEVYPVARDEAGESDEVAHSQEEHIEAEELLERLQDLDHTSSEFDDVLEELMEAVSHHIEEEEESVLPGLRTQLSDQRRDELGEAFIRSRDDHMGEQAGDATKEQLLQQARNAGLDVTSSMSKARIQRRLSDLT